MPPDAVIFDCDGLLVDSETAWTRAERVLYARRGVEFTEDHKRELLGTSPVVAQAAVERHLGLEPGEGASMHEELHELALIEVARHAPPMPGATELVAALRRRGTPIGLASNSPVALVEGALRAGGFTDAFDAVVSAQEVERPKPAPDVYLEACRRLGADPASCVALEDSPTGVAAARAAGLFVVGVPSMSGIELPGADVVAGSLRAPEVLSAVGLRLAA
ncbi:MAG TPA: HAD family phosphatase [Capillimicrobium sp.]|nr:HAD family phosphatase [Capillimicrobium sp.]